MRGRLVAVCGLLVLAAGCAGMCGGGKAVATTESPKTMATVAPAGTIVVELEKFTLAKWEVKNLEGASGGKAVLLVDEAGQAETTVELKAGTYDLVVYGLAPSYEGDAFYVRVGPQAEERRVIKDIKQLLPCEPLRFTMAKDGPCKVLITFAEENLLLDRVEIRPVK